jgi:biopolymer transport protein ExbB/TolQ
MKRILAIVFLIIVFVVLVAAASILWGGTRFSSFSSNEELVTAFLLTSVELIGLVVSIAVVIFILYQYIQFRRPYRLVFEAFSNESKLVDTVKKPLNLSILAQEELASQFKIIYRDLKEYSDKDSQDFEALVADELYIGEDSSGNDIGNYVSTDQIKKGGMIEDLREVIRDLKDPKGINLMRLVGEIAPKEVTPIMKFIEAIFPPHVIRATGHLQGKSDKSGREGITFEYVDLGSQRNLMVRTLRWQASDNREDSADSAPPAKSNMANGTLTNEESDHYIELLSPAMYWVALMFWEQKLISNVPLMNRILKAREKRRKARIFYLIGALYYAHSNRLYSSFFCQLAVEHLRLALITDKNWSLPYLYLANLYSFKALDKKGELHEKLLNEAFNLYDKALDLAEMQGEKFIQARIILAKALAELTSGLKTNDDGLIDRAAQEVEGLKTQMDPAGFEPARADCAAYLYNLATWYQIASDKYVYIPNVKSKDEARRYLAYSLVRSRSFWDIVENDINFKSMGDASDLEILKKELAKKLSEERELVRMTGENFKTEIGKILEKVDQLLGRPAR